jgi:hypothetical protein
VADWKDLELAIRWCRLLVHISFFAREGVGGDGSLCHCHCAQVTAGHHRAHVPWRCQVGVSGRKQRTEDHVRVPSDVCRRQKMAVGAQGLLGTRGSSKQASKMLGVYHRSRMQRQA